MAEPAILADDLVAVRGEVTALRGIDLEIEREEVVAIVGPSGSGKTTLLRCLAGLDRPTTGALRSFGVDLHDAGHRALAQYRARTVGVVQQHYTRALSPDLRVGELVGLTPGLLGWPATERRKRTHELLERVGLADRASARRIELSGGEQQRIAVCAALAARPRLLLADEPTGELDASTSATLIALIAELARSDNATVVIVTHDPAVAAGCERSLTIRDGRLVGERRRDEDELAVVDRAGMVRLTPEDREAAGIADRAQIRSTSEEIAIRAAGEPRHAPASPEPAPVAEPAATGLAIAAADVAAANGRPVVGGGAIVSLRDATRRYGSQLAVAALSFDLEPGSFTALVGPSGSGKTTVLHLIAGLERPTGGSVTVIGQDLDKLDRTTLAAFRRGRIAITGQSPALVPFLTAAENAELGALTAGVPRPQARAAALEALAHVGLADRAGQRAEGLSGGERHRLALARALATRPLLLLADEPTANLDQAGAAATGELLAAAARRGTTVLCATHDLLLAARADRRIELGGASGTASPEPTYSEPAARL